MLKLASRVRWSRTFGCILFVSFPGSLAGFCLRLAVHVSLLFLCWLPKVRLPASWESSCCFTSKTAKQKNINSLPASISYLHSSCWWYLHPECKKMTLYWCLISSPPFLLRYFCLQWINLWFRGRVIHAFPPALNLSPFWFWVFWFSRCRPCPSGTYSKQLLDDKGVTYMCEPCAPGWVQVLARRHMCIIIVIRRFIGWETKAQKLGCSFLLPEMKVKFGVPVSSKI